MNTTGINIRKEILLWSAVVLGALVFFASLRLEHTFFGDSLDKYVQAYSIKANAFQSEELHYPAGSLDPNHDFVPYMTVTGFDRLISPFPVAYGYISALVLTVGSPSWIYAFSLLLALASLLLLRYKLNLGAGGILFLVFASPFLYQYLGFGDVALASTLSVLALSLLLKGPSLKKGLAERSNDGLSGSDYPDYASKAASLFAGALFGIAVWFRMETAIIASLAILYFPISALLLGETRWKADNALRRTTIRSAYALVGFGLMLIPFFLFNENQYGHWLGSRFLYNQGGIQSFAAKWDIFVGVLLGGSMRLGFFGYMPLMLLFLAFAALRRNWIQRANPQALTLFLLFATGPFILALLAPNDSNIDWGSRYLNQLLFPFAFFVSPFLGMFSGKDSADSQERQSKSALRITVRVVAIILLVYSVLVTILFTALISQPPRKIKVMQKEILTVKADYRIFVSKFHAGQLSTRLVETPVLVLEDASLEQIDGLIQKMKESDVGTVALYTLDYELKGSPEEVQSQVLRDKDRSEKIQSLFDSRLELLERKALKDSSVRIYRTDNRP